MAVECRTAPTWTDVKAAFDFFRAGDFIFRGMPQAEWKLETTLQRLGSLQFQKDEIAILRYFQRRGRPLLPPGTDVSTVPTTTWLSLLQHYGGPTRLLDFTRSPYVATLFAFERPQPTPIAIWAVSSFALQNHALRCLDSAGAKAGEAVELVYRNQEALLNRVLRLPGQSALPRLGAAFPIEPLNFDPRQSSQQALFVCPSEPDLSVDSLLSEFSNGAVWKIEVPQEARAEALSDLIAMNVTPASLFPGLDGLGRAAALQAEFADYNKVVENALSTMPAFLRDKPYSPDGDG